jgi:phospholipase/carboxylesterase
VSALNFVHEYQAGAGPEVRTLLLLHGTGGNEQDLLEVGRSLDPSAYQLSPRGKVLERGMPRFFRRLAEGVFDEKDLIARTHELADFVQAASEKYRFDAGKVTAVGFSNGANIGGALMLLRPEVLSGAALWRPMIPLVPETVPELGGKRVLFTHGGFDTMVSEAQRRELERMFRGYGAAVESETFPTGHSLTTQDLQTTQRWLQGLAA